MIKDKLQSVGWFLKRPHLYVQFLYLLFQKLIRSSKENTRIESEQWCSGIAVSTSDAVEMITGKKIGKPIGQIYSDVFIKAHERARNCPVKMGGPGDLDLLYYLARHVGADKIIETGVAYGWSSLALLLAIRDNSKENSRLISIDMPYIKLDNDEYVGCVVPKDLVKFWKIHRKSDRQALAIALNEMGGTIDFCHYDSDKSYSGRMWAYPKLWNALRPGGYFISDDIGDNIAFKDFAESTGVKYFIIKPDGLKYVGVMIKP